MVIELRTAREIECLDERVPETRGEGFIPFCIDSISGTPEYQSRDFPYGSRLA